MVTYIEIRLRTKVDKKEEGGEGEEPKEKILLFKAMLQFMTKG